MPLPYSRACLVHRNGGQKMTQSVKTIVQQFSVQNSLYVSIKIILLCMKIKTGTILLVLKHSKTYDCPF